MRRLADVLPRLRRGDDGAALANEAADDRLEARDDVALAKALVQLRPGVQGWIDFGNYLTLFGASSCHLPPSKWDPDGQREIVEFGRAYDCLVRVVDRERRVYFMKIGVAAGALVETPPTDFDRWAVQTRPSPSGFHTSDV
jgi:hypothetical protein